MQSLNGNLKVVIDVQFPFLLASIYYVSHA